MFSILAVAHKDIDMLYTKTRCKMLHKGNTIMEGSLDGIYKLHIKAIPLITHACVAMNFGLSSYENGN